MEMKQQLSSKTIRRFHVAHSFEESHKHKKSLSFSRDGQRLVVCDHQSLSIFNCCTCTLICQVRMHPYRPEVVCYAPTEDRLLHSATKMDFAIRYLNLSTRQYVRLFNGHQRDVMNLCLQPGSEHCFVSTGRDKQLLSWDLRTAQPTQYLHEVENPLIAFDPTGKVIATCKSAKCIELYDVRKLGASPCQRFHYQVDSPAKWTQLQFSPDGKALLVATDFSCCFSVDAYNGGVLQAYTGWCNDRHLPLQACYTPDSQYVLAGADKGCVHVWHATSGRTVEVLQNSDSHSPIRFVQFNPKKMMFVTCDVITCFWQIKEKGKKKEKEAEEGEVTEQRYKQKELVEQFRQENQELKQQGQEVMQEYEQKKKRKRKKQKQAKQKEQEDKWALMDFEEWEQQNKQEKTQKMERSMLKEAEEEVEQQEELREELELELQEESLDEWEKEQLEKQQEQQEQLDEEQDELEQQEQRPKKRLRSVIIIPTIDLTSVANESSSEEEDSQRGLDDDVWMRGKLVRRRIVSYSPRPLALPMPRRRWPVWPRRRSPIEEGELIEDY